MPKRGLYPLANGPRFAAAAAQPRRASASIHSLDEVCSALASRLRGRLPELETSIATRVYTISDPSGVADPTYLHSLHGALTAALDYALAVIELGERRAPGVPPALLAEARLAARAGVALDTVLRRYCAGNSLLGDFLVEEAERAEVSGAALRRLLRRQATLFDRLLEAVSEEHVREAKSWPSSSAERRRECVKSLLAGELVDHSELGYDLDAHHLALMAKGEGSPEAMRVLAGKLDRRLLAVCREEEPVWACWLGGRHALEAEQALRALGEISLDRVLVTVGEPGEGLAGWRLSHRQAKAALPIAERRGQAVLHYADVALLASILRDDLVATSLHQLYLEPLERARDGGKVGQETLRAYFAAGRNISSTAAALGVDRRTVTNRIRAIEDLLGRPLKECATELETALQLDDC
ncbi:MAG TPA: helix-turn-helix domain-containing protein [Solirubrobacterales bacterium]